VFDLLKNKFHLNTAYSRVN